MASTSVGKLTADLIARTKAFEAGMKKANQNIRRTGKEAKRTRKSVQALGRSMKGLATAAVSLAGIGGFGSAVMSAIRFGSTQSDIANQLKINTTLFQTLSGAIRDAGGTQEQARKSILSQTQAIVQGSEGLTTYTRAFDRLGLNVDRLRGLKPAKQFEEIAKAVANAKDEQAALTAVSEIYGKRNAPELIEVMERLARDGFGKMADEIRRTYGIMDAETQRRLDIASDRIEQFKQRATIRVGEIIAGEANFAAIKELGFRITAIAARFGGRIVDAFVQSVEMLKAVFGALIDFASDRISKSFSNAIDDIRIKASEVMLEIKKFNPFTGHEKWLDALNAHTKMEREILTARANQNQEERKTWNDFFNQRMGRFIETDVASSLGAFWDNLADEQRKILMESQAALAANRPAISTGLSAAPATIPSSASSMSSRVSSSSSSSTGRKPALTGEALRSSANAQKPGFRFERLAEGGFQRFVDGSKSGTFSSSQLQSGLVGQPSAKKMTPQGGDQSDPVLVEILNIMKTLQTALGGA